MLMFLLKIMLIYKIKKMRIRIVIQTTKRSIGFSIGSVTSHYLVTYKAVIQSTAPNSNASAVLIWQSIKSELSAQLDPTGWDIFFNELIDAYADKVMLGGYLGSEFRLATAASYYQGFRVVAPNPQSSA